jgi:hypothetical protein
MNTRPRTHAVRADTGPAILAGLGRFGWRVMRLGTPGSHLGAVDLEAAAVTMPPGSTR